MSLFSEFEYLCGRSGSLEQNWASLRESLHLFSSSKEHADTIIGCFFCREHLGITKHTSSHFKTFPGWPLTIFATVSQKIINNNPVVVCSAITL